MDETTCTTTVQAAVNKLGSGFMMDGATFARAPEIGLDPGLGFYVIGRFGALGRVHADVVNAAAALWMAGVATDLADGMARAEQAATSGAANDVLERFIEMTGRLAPAG